MTHSAFTPEFDHLASTLRDIIQGRPVVFFINPGNWGDSLIREGAEAFLTHNGVTYTAFRFKDIIKRRKTLAQIKAQMGHPDPVMIYNGNGAFTSHYDIGKTIAKLTTEFGTSIVLPSTFAAEADALFAGTQAHLFVRDKFESQSNAPGVPFCHDMAFFLDAPTVPITRGTGLFMRRDTEAVGAGGEVKGNVDLSKKGRAHSSVDKFWKRIGAFEEIHTDRLHVGIAGALLGRRVHLYANNYFKIRAIYRSSMEEVYPNVTFHEGVLDLPKMTWRDRLPFV